MSLKNERVYAWMLYTLAICFASQAQSDCPLAANSVVSAGMPTLLKIPDAKESTQAPYFWIPAGAKLKVLKSSGSNECRVEFEGKAYYASATGFSYSKPAGKKQTYERSCEKMSTLDLIDKCEISNLDLVKRTASGSGKECETPALSEQANGNTSEWKACAPSFCSAEEAKIVKQWDAISLELKKARCQTLPNDQGLIDSLRAKARSLNSPSCLINFEKSPSKIVIHRTDFPETDGPEVIQNYHRLSQGFSDIGYHFLIAFDSRTKSWRVFEGRPLKAKGAHASAGLDNESIGIAIAGSDEENSQLNSQATQQLMALIQKLTKENSGIKEIWGHGEIKQSSNKCTFDCPPICVTACPGQNGQIVVEHLKSRFLGASAKPADVTPASR